MGLQQFSSSLPADNLKMEVGDVHRFNFGMLCVQIERLASEWRIEHCWGQLIHDEQLVWNSPITSRFIASGTSNKLSIKLMLADRPVVIRPLETIALLPDTRVNLYVSTTLWLAIMIDDRLLQELPSELLSDTWFGPNTRTGELCYASTTKGRLERNQLKPLPHKAVTPVTIKNYGSDILKLERINIPVPNLALFQHQGKFWTSGVSLQREQNMSQSKIDVRYEPSKELPGATQLAQARRLVVRGVIHKAVDLIFA
jgi:hypothetical protein